MQKVLRGQVRCLLLLGCLLVMGELIMAATNDFRSNDTANFWRKKTNVKQPDNVPLVFDAKWLDAWPRDDDLPVTLEEEETDLPIGPYGSIGGGNTGISYHVKGRVVQNRHGHKQNVAFIAGNAKSVGLKENWALKWHKNYNLNNQYVNGTFTDWANFMGK